MPALARQELVTVDAAQCEKSRRSGRRGTTGNRPEGGLAGACCRVELALELAWEGMARARVNHGRRRLSSIEEM